MPSSESNEPGIVVIPSCGNMPASSMVGPCARPGRGSRKRNEQTRGGHNPTEIGDPPWLPIPPCPRAQYNHTDAFSGFYRLRLRKRIEPILPDRPSFPIFTTIVIIERVRLQLVRGLVDGLGEKGRDLSPCAWWDVRIKGLDAISKGGA